MPALNCRLQVGSMKILLTSSTVWLHRQRAGIRAYVGAPVVVMLLLRRDAGVIARRHADVVVAFVIL